MGHPSAARPDRRSVIAGAVLLPTMSAFPRPGRAREARPAAEPLLVGSSNALGGMEEGHARLVRGEPGLDVVIDVVSAVEADPEDTSVGLGGLPNEDGVVQLDAACMDGATHNAGSVAALENILHPARVARLVMERTDHCLLVGKGAYEFARMHGHEHVDLLTEKAREAWLRWRETMSTRDDRLPPPAGKEDEKTGWIPGLGDPAADSFPRHGTTHCSALSRAGDVACTTTTSGLAFKVPGRVGDSPLIGCGLYCEAGSGSAGATGRGESAILANASSAVVALLRAGAHPRDAGLEVMSRIVEQTRLQAAWQPGLLDEKGIPSFGLELYALDTEGRFAGVTLRGKDREFAVANADGARLEPLETLF